MPQTIRAIVVDPAAPGRLAIKPVELRDPDRDEVQVKVTAISLEPRRDPARGAARPNRAGGPAGISPAWSRRAAADGSGPNAGTRVVGILPNGAWAERVNCRSHAVAALPDAVSDAQAATLPVAGLTALHALRQGGLLLGRKVLVDGASGGVGHLACQLANAAGALVWGHVRREEQRARVAEWCGVRVVVGRDLVGGEGHGPYWLIVDLLGGPALAGGARHAAAERHLRHARHLRWATVTVREPQPVRHRRGAALRPDPVPRADERRARLDWPGVVGRS